jgi:hypothetical protein
MSKYESFEVIIPKLTLNKILNSDDDWIESFRRSLYPLLHDPLSKLGEKIGVNLYAVGSVGGNQYVGKFDENEDAIEEEFDSRAERNPVAALKSLEDGRTSEGSWVVLHDHCPDLIEEGKQLHFTLFVREDGAAGRELYAHYEDDWRAAPLAHLRSENFSPEKGVKIAEEYLDEYTHLVRK